MPYNLNIGLIEGIVTMAVQEKKEQRLEARCAPEVKNRIEYAAELQGRSVTDFLITAADEQACRVIEQQRIVHLSMKDSRALADVLVNPPKPNAKAIEAAKRYRKIMGK